MRGTWDGWVPLLGIVSLVGGSACGEITVSPIGPEDSGAADATDTGTTATCPPGGPAALTPVTLGPAAGGTGDLWRGLYDDEGEGQSFEMPRNGSIDHVTAQLFAPSSVGHCELRIVRWCDGEPVEAARADIPAAQFPAYVLVDPTKTIWDQDLSETNIPIDPPVGVTQGERVDLVFRAVDTSMVSVISMSDIAPDGHAVFPNGAPGIPNFDTLEWDYHARLQLR